MAGIIRGVFKAGRTGAVLPPVRYISIVLIVTVSYSYEYE